MVDILGWAGLTKLRKGMQKAARVVVFYLQALEIRAENQHQKLVPTQLHLGSLVADFPTLAAHLQVLAVLVEDIVVVDTLAKVDVHTKEAPAAVARAVWVQIMYTEPVLLVEQ